MVLTMGLVMNSIEWTIKCISSNKFNTGKFRVNNKEKIKICYNSEIYEIRWRIALPST